ncbi:anti-sigma-I factor RsgI family protein [Pseudobacteroides cellulosolvens]|uniref:Anti-sigma factor RsgI, N-terminal n=1 Tax=Pseudobacteroides cellulosolvens ATCC 35603 = DSM 2933 TaxID=398512 RepID=A0A0L6JXP0_9FIRM|nr:hypothetical protein [Pseudobacteroides cellulosolvens]KNY30335.1 Anti-sigma factor RsgI, N-terminal [Pseudobacteroides cellulosolvens ATCC 35603 = DSM 2933]
MIKSGVIIKLEKKEAIVFNDLLEYEKIKRVEGMFEGQTIEYRTSKYENVYKKLKILSGAAAVLVLIFSFYMWFAVISRPQIFAFVDLDINPSMEFSIDENNCVIGLKPLNSDAQKIVDSLDETSGKPINEAINYVIIRLHAEGILKRKKNHKILISSTPNSTGLSQDEKKDIYKKLDDTMKLIEGTLSKQKDVNISVKTYLSKDPEIRKNSQENKMSIARYAVYESDRISLQDAKSATVDKLLEYLPDNKSKDDILSNASVDDKGKTASNETLNGTKEPIPSGKQNGSQRDNSKKAEVDLKNDYTGSDKANQDKSHSNKKDTYSDKDNVLSETNEKDDNNEYNQRYDYTPAIAVTPIVTYVSTVLPQVTLYPTANPVSTAIPVVTSPVTIPVTTVKLPVITPHIPPAKTTPNPTAAVTERIPGTGRPPVVDRNKRERNGWGQEDKHEKDLNGGTEPGKLPMHPNTTQPTIKPDFTPHPIPSMGPATTPAPKLTPVPTPIPTLSSGATPGAIPTWKPGPPEAIPTWKPGPPEGRVMPRGTPLPIPPPIRRP